MTMEFLKTKLADVLVAIAEIDPAGVEAVAIIASAEARRRISAVKPVPRPSSARIIKAVADANGFTIDDLKGRAVGRAVTLARRQAMLALDETRLPDGSRAWSRSAISRMFKRDPSCIHWALKGGRGKWPRMPEPLPKTTFRPIAERVE